MKKLVVILVFIVFAFNLSGCTNILGMMGLLGADKNSTTTGNPSLSQATTSASTFITMEPTTNQNAQDGYWEQYDVQVIVPKNQTVGDQKDLVEYDFSSSKNSISLNMVRTGTGGTEIIETYGSWSLPEKEYFAGHTIRLDLSAAINKFDRKWTNYSGVNAYAYLGSESTPLGSATNQALRDISGEGTCSATINNGKITIGQANKEVSIAAPKGSDNQKMVIFVVVSNQGKQGGAKYYYAWKDW
ncbi:hypothetical protein JXO59_09600 [candidate division KSB1 bacterium]|nr:hypothetical protein [candidate division KSB1 bacterium]